MPTANNISGRPKNKHTGGNVWLLSGFASATHSLKAGRIHATVAIPLIIGTDKLLHQPVCKRLDDFKKARGELGRPLEVMLIREKIDGSRHFSHLLIRQSV